MAKKKLRCLGAKRTKGPVIVNLGTSKKASYKKYVAGEEFEVEDHMIGTFIGPDSPYKEAFVDPAVEKAAKKKDKVGPSDEAKAL